MTDNPKRSLPDIDNLIAQVESLRRRIRLVQKKDFRTPVQKEILAQRADTPWKLALFHHTHPNQFDEEFGVIDRYFRPTGSLDRGRFVQDIGTVRSGQIIESSETQPHYELYNPQRHHPSKKLIERYVFNEKALRVFLKSYTSVKRREYWDKSIKPQIEKIDLGLTPWIRLAKDYDIDVRNPLVIQTVDNADPGKLDQLIYDLKRLQQVKDSKTPYRLKDKVGGMIITHGQAS